MTEAAAKAKRIKEIFSGAVECVPSDREEFLSEFCGDNADLRAEILSLLDSFERNEDFLQSPALDVSAGEIIRQIDGEESSAIGRNIGAYRIVREIGRGGMGAVFLAERTDGEFKKQVAVKLLRRGMENAEIIRRFHNERQILADLEHPLIARLIDGGTTPDGLPFFVMEYVEGSPADHFCDERHLAVEERLRLFRKICDAVQFAHEHSVIHRDIKPSNILVTPDGKPKLLDFGIAKILPSNRFINTETTAAAFRLMTPDYASPEQIKGERVGYAADIYSLGALLYKLLTGNLPYRLDGKSPFEIARTISETAPAPLTISNGSRASSTGGRGGNEFDRGRLPEKDLDTILQKALRKEPERRYRSVKEFSDDLERFLEGLPVSARQDSIFYPAACFLRRRRKAVLPVIGTALLFFLVGFSLNMFGSRESAAKINGADSAKVTDRGLPIERNLGGTDNPEARSFYLRAQTLWNQRTLASLKSAAELFRQATEKDPEFALAYSGLSNTYFLLSVWGSVPAREIFPGAKAASLKAIELAPEAAEGHLSLAMVHWLYEYDWQAADREFKKAIELNPDYARAPHWYGLFLAEMGRFDEAVAAAERALALEPQSIPVNADAARVLFYARRYDESLAQYRKTIKMSPNFEAFYGELFELFAVTGITPEWFDLIEKTNYFDNPSLRKAYQTGNLNEFLHKAIGWYQQPNISHWQIHYSEAAYYAARNDRDRAFESLSKAFAERDHRMSQIKVHPVMDNLRSDPRFAALLQKMNF